MTTKPVRGITLNNEQQLYVIPCGDGFTCWGFRNCFEEAEAIAKIINWKPPRQEDFGTIEMYHYHRVMLKHVIDNRIDLGTWFSPRTDAKVRDILETARRTGRRLRLFYGDTDTGRDWVEENDVVGEIGRSTGTLKVPLLIANSRSSGGGAILTDCIVRIMDYESKREMYRHPKYKMPVFEIGTSNTIGYLTAVKVNGELHAQFKKEGQAERWVAFMKGERMAP